MTKRNVTKFKKNTQIKSQKSKKNRNLSLFRSKKNLKRRTRKSNKNLSLPYRSFSRLLAGMVHDNEEIRDDEEPVPLPPQRVAAIDPWARMEYLQWRLDNPNDLTREDRRELEHLRRRFVEPKRLRNNELRRPPFSTPTKKQRTNI